MRGKEYFLRQKGIVSPEQLRKQITIIGVGGIGSPSVFELARMGCSNLKTFDDDIVKEHNQPCGVFRLCDVGKPKVIAAAEIIMEFTGIKIEAVQEKYDDQPLSGIVISGVHTMEARKKIWKKVKGNTDIEFYIDGRMGSEDAVIFPVYPWDKDRVAFYERKLTSDKEAAEEPCTRKAIVYNTSAIGAFIACLVKQHVISETKVIPKMLILQFYSWTLVAVM